MIRVYISGDMELSECVLHEDLPPIMDLPLIAYRFKNRFLHDLDSPYCICFHKSVINLLFYRIISLWVRVTLGSISGEFCYFHWNSL